MLTHLIASSCVGDYHVPQAGALTPLLVAGEGVVGYMHNMYYSKYYIHQYDS